MLYSTINSSKFYTKNQKTLTEYGLNGVSRYSCAEFCTPGTLIIGVTTVTSCCSTNNCNTGKATPDTNKLWCNYGEKGWSSLGKQSCSTKCMVRKNKLLMG